MSLRLEHLHFHRNKRAFGQLLTCFVLIANQDTCCYSALSSLLSICVGTQSQEVTFLFCILLVFASFHCSYLSQSVCLKSVIQLSPQLHCHFQIWQAWFLFYFGAFTFYIFIQTIGSQCFMQSKYPFLLPIVSCLYNIFLPIIKQNHISLLWVEKLSPFLLFQITDKCHFLS